MMPDQSESYIIDPEKRIPVVAQVDVAVVGGGPAGLCSYRGYSVLFFTELRSVCYMAGSRVHRFTRYHDC